MKMKWYVFGIVILFTFSTTIVNANESEDSDDGIIEIDNETQKETKIMCCSYGPNIRFLQLEKAILNNIYKGELIIEKMNDSGYDTLTLEAILAEIILIKDDIKSVDLNLTDISQIYVELKTDAINITNSFREEIKDILNETEIAEYKNLIQEKTCQQNKNFTSEIKNMVRKYNTNQLNWLNGIFKCINNSIINQYQNGVISLDTVKQQIHNYTNQLNEKNRYNFYSEIKETQIRNKIHAKITIEDVSENYQQRLQDRIRNRINNSENLENGQIRNQIQQRLRNRLNQTEDANYYNGPNPGKNGEDWYNNDDITGDQGQNKNGQGPGGNGGRP